MTPPDSDEREACGAMVARVNGVPLLCEMPRDHDGAHEAKLAGPLSASGAVAIPLPLAQRILAALEGKVTQEGYEESAALAAELRERMGQKP